MASARKSHTRQAVWLSSIKSQRLGIDGFFGFTYSKNKLFNISGKSALLTIIQSLDK